MARLSYRNQKTINAAKDVGKLYPNPLSLGTKYNHMVDNMEIPQISEKPIM